MEDNKQIVLTPEYMKRFKCIGKKCEDNCCATDWDIYIDRQTYNKYINIKDTQLKPLINEYVKKKETDAAEQDYARICFNEKKQCIFLNDSKLCIVQKKYGEDYLCNVCATYPRFSRIINGVIEEAGTVSCPEIARLALLKKEGIAFDYIEESVNKRHIIARTINKDDPVNTDHPRKFIWDIREFTIDLLQNRNMNINSRLILLGNFINRLGACVKDENMNQIPKVIESYRQMIDSSDISDMFSQIPVQFSIQMQLLKELSDIRFKYKFYSSAYLECFMEFLHGINYSTGSSEQANEIGSRYQKAYGEYYRPFFDKHEYIYENYLVNYVFKNVFPFGSQRGMLDEYNMLVLHYSLIKMILIGMSAYHKGLSVDLVIKLIQSFSKTNEHNMWYTDELFKVIKENKFDSLAYMTILINN